MYILMSFVQASIPVVFYYRVEQCDALRLEISIRLTGELVS